MIEIEAYAGIHTKNLELLGKGTQGTVYKINSEKCIKIFKSSRACIDEFNTLMMAQGNPHFPAMYSSGYNYIIREYIQGQELNKYLTANFLSEGLCYKIIELYEAMRAIGFTRLDTAIFHIFITPSGDLKLIDTAKAMKKKTVYPKLILNGLAQAGYMESFLNSVEKFRPELFNLWLISSSKNNRSKVTIC